MKRYLIFGAVGPLIGGFLLLFVTTWTSGYWTDIAAWPEGLHYVTSLCA